MFVVIDWVISFPPDSCHTQSSDLYQQESELHCYLYVYFETWCGVTESSLQWSHIHLNDSKPGLYRLACKRARLIPAVNLIGWSIKAGCKRPWVEKILWHLPVECVTVLLYMSALCQLMQLPTILHARMASMKVSFCANTTITILKCS